ncbi:MAG: accessory factor UbiK family protein [Chromatiales bacterium]|nr:accessory factor UbiK family protein [Gammaproteobacteria bacterium]MBW6477652.1 accessory factor UbiK family protein [Chromatiales bacterium]
MQNNFIDEISQKLAAALPPGAQQLKDDLEKNARSILHAQLSKLDLVTREEFAVQSQVLARSRAKLEAMEKRLAELEAQLLRPLPGSSENDPMP